MTLIAAANQPRRSAARWLATRPLLMQMVANGFGVILLPEIAADVEIRDGRVKLLRFADPQPARTLGLAWRRTSPRKQDFAALGLIIAQTVGHIAKRYRGENAPSARNAISLKPVA